MNKKPYHYKESGLDYVYLNGGVIRKETNYGVGYAIIDLENLHKTIAKYIVTNARPIRSQEMRFLRSVMELSQTDLAKIMRDQSAFARWESDPYKPLEGMADTAMRFTYIGHVPAK